MKRWRVLALMAAGMALAVSSWADTVHGRVVVGGQDAIAVVIYDDEGLPYPNPLTLRVDDQTRLEGLDSAQSLQKGDPVRLEVSRMPTGLWRADAISPLPKS